MLLLLTNHTAADTNEFRQIQATLHELEMDVEVVVSQSVDETKRHVQAAAKTARYEAALIHGGDGTVAPALKAAAGTELPILILPGGTDNSLARSTKSAVDVQEALAHYASGRYLMRYLPVATANAAPFMVDAHFGWSEQSLTTTPPGLKRMFGRLAYTLNAVKTKADLEPHDYRVQIDGAERIIRGYTCIIANHGNPMLPGLPLFRRRPNRLQIAILKRHDTLSLLKWYVARRFMGRTDSSVVYIARGKNISLLEGPDRCILDEQPTTPRYPFECSLTDTYAKVISTQYEPRDWRAVWRWLQTGYYRNTDQLRRIVTGVPSERFSRISPHLLLGGQYSSRALEEFEQRGVTGVVSMRTHVPEPLEASHGIEILHLPTTDRAAPSMNDLQKGADFIHRKIQEGGTVYVHCHLGEGRGPTMAAAYLISQGMRPQDAIAHLQYFRPFANPTKPQLKRLIEFWQKQQ